MKFRVLSLPLRAGTLGVTLGGASGARPGAGVEEDGEGDGPVPAEDG